MSTSAAVLLPVTGMPRPLVQRQPLPGYVHIAPRAHSAAVHHALPGSAVVPHAQVQRHRPSSVALQLPDGWALLQSATSRVLGTVGGNAAMPRTFHCPFCLENVREEVRVVLAACGSADHGVCRECMGHYIRGLVVDGRVHRIGCHICGAPASPLEVLALTDRETQARFERFREMREDPSVRECPSCRRLCRPCLDEEENIVAEMVCEECLTEFCYYHSNAHAGRQCTEYRREIARQERHNERGVLRGTKACPSCGIRTEKTGGCNHMTCLRCRVDWCWICEKRLEDGQGAVYEHYHGGGPRGCRQFEDFDPHSPLACLLRCLVIPVQLASVLFFIVLSLTMLVWLPVAFLCFTPCHRCSIRSEFMECVLLCSINLAFMPFVAFQLAWILCAALLWMTLKPCGAECGHLVYLMQVPFASVLPLIAGFLRLRGRRRQDAEEDDLEGQDGQDESEEEEEEDDDDDEDSGDGSAFVA